MTQYAKETITAYGSTLRQLYEHVEHVVRRLGARSTSVVKRRTPLMD
jgi:hypothetical protein